MKASRNWLNAGNERQSFSAYATTKKVGISRKTLLICVETVYHLVTQLTVLVILAFAITNLSIMIASTYLPIRTLDYPP